MKTKELSNDLSDSQLAVEMLKRKLVNEAQLKAAIDYQESVGGRLVDVMLKLGLVRQKSMDAFLSKLALSDEDSVTGEFELDVSRLKVHKKLLEKVPSETVAKYGILFFFPPPGTRAILMSCVPEAPEEAVRELRSLLGVEIKTIHLDVKVRERFVQGGERRAAAPGPRPQAKGSAPAAPERTTAPEAGAADAQERLLLQALVNLLIRKKLVTSEELKVELELVKHKDA